MNAKEEMNLTLERQFVAMNGPKLMPFGVASLTMSCIGVVANAWLLLAALRSAELRSKSHILISALAVADLAVCAGFGQVQVSNELFKRFSQIALTVDIRQQFLRYTQRQCFLAILPFSIALNANGVMVLTLGIDRLLALWQAVR